MYRKLTASFVLLASSLMLWATGKTTSVEAAKASNSSFSVEVSSSENDALVKLTSASMDVYLENGTFNYDQAIDGLIWLSDDHLPKLPVIQKKFVLPPNYSLSWDVVTSPNQRSSARWEIFDEDNTKNMSPSRLFESEDNFFPQSNVVVTQEKYRGYNLITVAFFPVRCNSTTGEVSYSREISLKLKYSQSSSKVDFVPDNFDPTQDYILSGYTQLIPFSPVVKSNSNGEITSVPENYLIVTTSDLYPAAEKLANWKSLYGYKVDIVKYDSWTSEKIKSIVERFYKQKYSLSYLLILGDAVSIPPCHGSIYWDEQPTDYPYVCMDGGNDQLADICNGRIPAKNITEAQTIVDKIISYELYPVVDESFYKTGLNVSWYQDHDFDGSGETIGKENREKILPSERIKYYIEHQTDRKVNRVYTKFANNPIKDFYKIDPIFGGHMPDELLYSYDWEPANKGNDLICNYWRAGTNYVMYNAHGGVLRWGNPYLDITDVDSKLTCGKKLPVVFSTTCLTGKFDEECIAYELLKSSVGGSIATIAASNESNSDYNPALCEALLDCMYGLGIGRDYIPDNYSVQKEKTVGHMLMSGIAKAESWNYSSYPHRQMYHCLGDPSTYIRTENPEDNSSNVWIGYFMDESEGIEVEISDGYAKVIMYNPITKQHIVYSSVSHIVQELDDMFNWSVLVLQEGRTPKISIGLDVWDYFDF